MAGPSRRTFRTPRLTTWSAEERLKTGGGEGSAPVERRGRRRAHAPDLMTVSLALGAVIVDLAAVVDDVASGRDRHRGLRVEVLPVPTHQVPDRTAKKRSWGAVRPAHVAGQPLDAHTYGPACSDRRTIRLPFVPAAFRTHLMSAGVVKSTASVGWQRDSRAAPPSFRGPPHRTSTAYVSCDPPWICAPGDRLADRDCTRPAQAKT